MSRQMYDLIPQYDSAKSFGSKARVEIEDGVKTLYSYNTKVAEISEGHLSVFNTQSATTLRHVKEFAKQNGFSADTKAEILAKYC